LAFFGQRILLGYNVRMAIPVNLVTAIVNSVITAIVDAPPTTTTTAPIYSAMARTFPANTKKGELTLPIQQQVVISGVTLNAAPAMQVRNEQNLIVMPFTLQGILPVRYQLDQMGNVWRIWILSAAEQAAPEDPTAK